MPRTARMWFSIACSKGEAAGFYIDVGAWDPVVDSVTKHFYDKGWRGINVEPVAHYYERLAAERTGDINLKVAVGAESKKEERFVELEGSGLSGFSSTLNRSAISALGLLGFRFPERAIDIEVVPLAEIAGRYAQRQVDFLKIDVEGSERGVIESADWRAFRPRVVLVEAVAPLSGEPAWSAWESSSARPATNSPCSMASTVSTTGPRSRTCGNACRSPPTCWTSTSRSASRRCRIAWANWRRGSLRLPRQARRPEPATGRGVADGRP
jgi:FkbM family methyltransferase